MQGLYGVQTLDFLMNLALIGAHINGGLVMHVAPSVDRQSSVSIQSSSCFCLESHFRIQLNLSLASTTSVDVIDRPRRWLTLSAEGRFSFHILPSRLHQTTDMSTTSHSSDQTYSTVLSQLLPPSKPYPLLPSFSDKPYNPSLSSAIAALSLHPTLEALLHILNNDLPSAHFLVRHMQSPMPLTASCRTCSPPSQPAATNSDSNRPTMAQVASTQFTSSTAQAPTPTSTKPPSPTPTPHHPPTHLSTTPSSPPSTSAKDTPPVPKAEGLALHALLHRIELDIENARAWYRDLAATAPAIKLALWPSTATRTGSAGTQGALPTDDVECFLERVDAVRGAHPNLPPRGQAGARASGGEGSRADAADVQVELVELERESGREVRALLEWLERRYGIEAWADVSGEWTSHGDKIGEMAKQQVIGGEGWRSF